MRFDTKTSELLKSYVYALIDPRDNKPFYIGKGIRNRVFNHIECALDDDTGINNKYETIKAIKKLGKDVKHIIIRHGLEEKMAFEIEAAFLDFFDYQDHELTNKVLGHNSLDNGLMSAKEIIGKYNAKKLEELSDSAVIININKSYKEQKYKDNGVYLATKELWSMDKNKVQSIKYVLAEYQSLIVEVYKVNDWYSRDTTTSKGKHKMRWGFNGVIAEETIRNKYINKSIKEYKKIGQANPIRYTLKT